VNSYIRISFPKYTKSPTNDKEEGLFVWRALGKRGTA